jgi:uncharacterized membrane protein
VNTRELALTGVYSALVVVVAYAKGIATSSLPGVFEFMTILIFIAGYCFGKWVGVSVGSVSLAIYMLIPYPFAHPAAWLYTISPVLLIVMMLLGTMFGCVGWFSAKIIKPDSPRFSLMLAILGFTLTFVYDIMSSVGFALAYPAFSDVWSAIYLTFIPLYYPWPPIIHTFTNTIIFWILGTPLIRTIKKLPETLNTTKAYLL